LKVTQFKDEAQERSVSIETVRDSFEKAIDERKILGIISPNQTEVICFEGCEIEALASELSCGKISLTHLAKQLNLTVYQLRLVIQSMLKTKHLEGELTYNTFISKITLNKMTLEKAKEQKRNHRLKLRNKRP